MALWQYLSLYFSAHAQRCIAAKCGKTIGQITQPVKANNTWSSGVHDGMYPAFLTICFNIIKYTNHHKTLANNSKNFGESNSPHWVKQCLESTLDLLHEHLFCYCLTLRT